MYKFIDDVATRFIVILGLAILCLILFFAWFTIILGLEQLLNHVYFGSMHDYVLDFIFTTLILSIITVGVKA